jgi:hypothetical protein
MERTRVNNWKHIWAGLQLDLSSSGVSAFNQRLHISWQHVPIDMNAVLESKLRDCLLNGNRL